MTDGMVKQFTDAMAVDPDHLFDAVFDGNANDFTINYVPIGYRVHAGEGEETDGWVYFIRADRMVKIGFAKEVANRLPTLQTGSPVKLQEMVSIQAKQQREGEFHERFAAHRVLGEWFRIEGPLLAFLDHYYRRQRIERQAKR